MGTGQKFFNDFSELVRISIYAKSLKSLANLAETVQTDRGSRPLPVERGQQVTARAIIAEAERAAQDLVARAVKIKAEADRALDDAKSKAVCIQKRAQAALALAENIAEGRRLIDALGG